MTTNKNIKLYEVPVRERGMDIIQSKMVSTAPKPLREKQGASPGFFNQPTGTGFSAILVSSWIPLTPKRGTLKNDKPEWTVTITH